MANLFRFFGATGNKFADAILTDKEANLLAAIVLGQDLFDWLMQIFKLKLLHASLQHQ